MKLRLYITIALAITLFSCKKEAQSGSGTSAEGGKSQKTDEKVLLRLNYKKGDKQMLSFDMQTKADGGVSVEEQIGLSLEVADITLGDNPNYIFSGEVTYIKMDTDMMGEKDYYDSSKKVENMDAKELEWHKDFGDLIHKPLTFTLSSRGKVVKSFEYEGGAATAMDQPIELNNYQIAFPEKEVGIGDSWKSEYQNPLTNTTVKNTYTLTAITAETVVVSVKSLVPGMKGIIKENHLTGEYTIDRKTGMLLEGKMEGTLSQMNAKMNYTFTGTVIK